jgi:hypothetical protein
MPQPAAEEVIPVKKLQDYLLAMPPFVIGYLMDRA